MYINWALEHELDLHNLLKHWAQNGVSAQQIGESLVNMLYKRDGYLGYRVTKMVDRCESYRTIGNDMLEHTIFVMFAASLFGMITAGILGCLAMSRSSTAAVTLTVFTLLVVPRIATVRAVVLLVSPRAVVPRKVSHRTSKTPPSLCDTNGSSPSGFWRGIGM